LIKIVRHKKERKEESSKLLLSKPFEASFISQKVTLFSLKKSFFNQGALCKVYKNA